MYDKVTYERYVEALQDFDCNPTDSTGKIKRSYYRKLSQLQHDIDI